jgi:PAS domain S-box-containing protein
MYLASFVRSVHLVESPLTQQAEDNNGRSSEHLTQRNELFRLLVETVKDYAIFVLDPEGHILTWNDGARAIKGYSKAEIVGQHFSKFYLPEAVESGWPARELALAEKEGRFADEGWRVKKDGSVFWASVIITPLRDAEGQLCGFAKVTQDLSERKKADERIQNLNSELRNRVTQLDETRAILDLRTLELRKVSARLLQVQDEERRRIARELHDDLGQQLAYLKMTLDVKAGNEQASQLTNKALATVRNLSYLLHPPLLDETGLRAALHWYVDGMVKRSNIEVSLTMQPSAFPRLTQDVETAIFRVVQESLTNVYRHSGTEAARVEIVKQPECVLVRVRDYGSGMPADLCGKSATPGLGVGINGMRERLRQFGGELVVSRAEPGTLVEAKVPILAGNMVLEPASL